MWKKSLKSRLTFYIAIPVIMALLAIGGVGFYSAYNEAEDVYDTELSHVADLMLSLLRAEDHEEIIRHGHDDDDDKKINPDIVELGGDFDTAAHSHEEKLAFRIWKGGELIFYSRKASEFGEERVTAGFSDQEIDGKKWRFYVLPDSKSGYTLEVAQRSKVRTALITKVLTTIFSPLILLLPVIIMLTWIGIRNGLRPLLAVSDSVKRRSSLDLTPISTCQSLAEITPLIDSINGLLSNLDYALEKERRFTDFAAHELRTPIAIFKTQAQTALKATNDAQRRMILEAQVQAADRATSLVDQLLTLARLEHIDIPTSSLSLGDIARGLVVEMLPLAQQKNIGLHFEQETPVMIKGNHDILVIMLSNLIINAIKYTPDCGEVIVSVSAHDNAAIFCVSDTGPGIPEESLPYVTERFYRVSSHLQPGAGLGLTIVKRASAIMGATLTLHNKDMGKGLESILKFPDITSSS